MTCIVGVEYDGKVLIGGDIQGTGHNNKLIHTQPKVFNKNGIIFGFTTSYRFGQILEHGLVNPIIPESDDEIYRWLITIFVPSAMKALKDSEFTGGGNCLIGIRGQLWELQNDYSVLRSTRGYGAVGSGYEYALGSIKSSLVSKLKTEADYREVVRLAIETAGEFSPSVGTNSVIIST